MLYCIQLLRKVIADLNVDGQNYGERECPVFRGFTVTTIETYGNC